MLKKCVWDLNTSPPLPLRRPLSVLYPSRLLPRTTNLPQTQSHSHFTPTNPPQTPTTQPPTHPTTYQTHATTLHASPTYPKLLLSHLLQPILPTPPQAHSTCQPHHLPTTHATTGTHPTHTPTQPTTTATHPTHTPQTLCKHTISSD